MTATVIPHHRFHLTVGAMRCAKSFLRAVNAPELAAVLALPEVSSNETACTVGAALFNMIDATDDPGTKAVLREVADEAYFADLRNEEGADDAPISEVGS